MFGMRILNREDGEFQMLLEVAEEYGRQKIERTPQKKSGDATEIVIRSHLLKKGFNMTLNPDLKIQGSNKRVEWIDSLLLKPNADPNKPIYHSNEVDTVIEIKNNGVAEQSKKIKEKFDKAREISENFRFAVIVLSERLLSRTPYKHAITEEKLQNRKYRVFTLIARREYPKYPKYPRGGLYTKDVDLAMLEKGELWKTGEWEKLIAYLKE